MTFDAYRGKPRRAGENAGPAGAIAVYLGHKNGDVMSGTEIMELKTAICGAFALTVLGASAALADAKIYPETRYGNFCPAGHQPVRIDGVICCGQPNQSVSYQSMMRQPAGKVHRAKSAKRALCPVGEKGCRTQ